MNLENTDFLYKLYADQLDSYLGIYESTGRGVEIGEFCKEPALSDPTTARELVRLFRDNLPTDITRTLHGPFWDINPQSEDAAIRALARDKIRRAIEIAAELYCRRIVFHTSLLPMVNVGSLVEKNLRTARDFWLETADNSPLEICLENTWELDTTQLAALVLDIPHPRLRVCIDVGHIFAFSRIPAREWFETFRGTITHLHWHDNHLQKDEHLPLGRGKIDWREIETLCRANAPDATIVLELSKVEDFTSSLEYLENLEA